MSFKSLVNKLVKEGKSREAATKIAGKVANAKMKGAGSGPTAKQKARMKKGSPNKMKDLSGDGKVTKKDVLIGRGVLKKDGSPAKMDHGKKSPAKMSKKRDLMKKGYSRKTAKTVAKNQRKREKARAELKKVGEKYRKDKAAKEKMATFESRYGAGAKKAMKAADKTAKKAEREKTKAAKQKAKDTYKKGKAKLKDNLKTARQNLKKYKKSGGSPAQRFQAYDQMDTRNAKQTAGSPMGMYGKHSPANAYGSPMKMSGQSYDAKQAYNKNLSASARLHYLENNRADAKAKKGGHAIHKHMGGRR